MRYIARPDTWFKANTEVKLLDDYRPQMPNSGLFLGLRVVENSEAEGGNPVGSEGLDEEICTFDEFYIIDEN